MYCCGKNFTTLVSKNTQFDKFVRNRAIKRKNYFKYLEQEFENEIKRLIGNQLANQKVI
jgi:hypothetical protein